MISFLFGLLIGFFILRPLIKGFVREWRKNQGYVSPEDAARNYADHIEPYDRGR